MIYYNHRKDKNKERFNDAKFANEYKIISIVLNKAMADIIEENFKEKKYWRLKKCMALLILALDKNPIL